jgi:RNA polymerase sigma factor (sigma-70 family)
MEERPEGDAVVTGLPRMMALIQQTGGGLSDAQLLERFLARRDESAFAAIVARHGPMVLGVCRRVLGNHHDAEDAFQAAFLVLARRAADLRPRTAVGPWLYGVSYRTALGAAAARARRRSRERQVRDMPHPQVAPAEVPDWRPLLDRELSRLSERYRAAVVLCDLEGKTRKEAARLQGVPESTLANRLARARALLAKRLRGRGVELTGAALAVALSAETASAGVPAALLRGTVRAAAGQLTAASAPAVLLMKGVMQAMLIRKVKFVVLAVLVTAALGAVGLAFRPGDEARAQDTAAAAPRGDGKPLSELEALRRENRRLRKNIEILLDRISAQDATLKAQAQEVGAQRKFLSGALGVIVPDSANGARAEVPIKVQLPTSDDPTREVESALKALREARDPEARRRAAQALERATQRIRQQFDPAAAAKKKGS